MEILSKYGNVKVEISGNSSVFWGNILGMLSNQTDLQNALNAKQDTLTLTTTGTSGAATLVGATLNIPQYSGGGASGITIGTTAITLGTVGRVLFEGTGNVVSQSGNLFWDNTNGRLGIGTSSPSNKLDVVGTTRFSGTTRVETAGGLNGFTVFDANNAIMQISAGTTPYTFRFLVLGGGQAFEIRDFNQSDATRLRIGNTGNVLINTTTDAGYKLDVNGTARVKGASNVSTTTAFTIANSDSTNLLQVQDNGYIRIGSQGTSAFRVYATDASGDSEPSGLNLVLNSRVVSQSTAAGIGMVTINGIAGTATTGNQSVFLISKGFSPTSGTATYTATSIIPTINQTGGANGITRGLYIAPTLTAAFDFRAIETTVGNVLLGTTSGNVGIGTSSPASLLDVNGTIKALGLRSDIINNTANTVTLLQFSGTGNRLFDNSGTQVLNLRGGNLQIGTTTDAGYKLDVNGTARVGVLTCGNINPSGTTAVSGVTIYLGTIDNGPANNLRVISKGTIFSDDYSFLSSASALLEVKSTTKGFLPPRMSNAQMLAIATPATSLMVYDTTNNKLCCYDGATWQNLF